jgi:hypothetical protein
MPLEVVRRSWDIEIVARPPMVPLTPHVVRHHTTHAHPVVCVECARALSPEHATRNDAGEWICKDGACT